MVRPAPTQRNSPLSVYFGSEKADNAAQIMKPARNSLPEDLATAIGRATIISDLAMIQAAGGVCP